MSSSAKLAPIPMFDDVAPTPAPATPTATPDPAPAGHNNPPRCTTEAEAFKAYANLGARAGRGALSEPEFLALVAENTRLGLHGAVNSDKGKELWSKFRKQKLSVMGQLVVDPADEKNFAQKASNVTTVMFAALKADMAPAFAFVRRALPAMVADGESKHNTWNGFAAVASAQKKQDAPLSEDEIRKALMPKDDDAPKAYNEQVALENALKALKALTEGKKASDKSPAGKPAYPSDQAKTAMALIETRLAQVTLKKK